MKSEFFDISLKDCMAYQCLVHKNKFNRTLSDNVLIFVHPFYPEMGGAEFALTKEYAAYKAVINECLRNNNYTKAWFTFPLVYEEGRALLEEGVFSKAFFTDFGSGYPLDEEELDEFRGKKLIILGCYVEQCIDELIESFNKRSVDDISILCEGVLFGDMSPEGIKRNNDYLFDRYMDDGIMRRSKVIHLNNLI